MGKVWIKATGDAPKSIVTKTGIVHLDKRGHARARYAQVDEEDVSKIVKGGHGKVIKDHDEIAEAEASIDEAAAARRAKYADLAADQGYGDDGGGDTRDTTHFARDPVTSEGLSDSNTQTPERLQTVDDGDEGAGDADGEDAPPPKAPQTPAQRKAAEKAAKGDDAPPP